jgi:hypothetical protein
MNVVILPLVYYQSKGLVFSIQIPLDENDTHGFNPHLISLNFYTKLCPPVSLTLGIVKSGPNLANSI